MSLSHFNPVSLDTFSLSLHLLALLEGGSSSYLPKRVNCSGNKLRLRNVEHRRVTRYIDKSRETPPGQEHNTGPTHKHTTPLPSPRPHPAHTTTPRRPERNRQLAREIECGEMWTGSKLRIGERSPFASVAAVSHDTPPTARRADRQPLIHNAKAVSNKESGYKLALVACNVTEVRRDPNRNCIFQLSLSASGRLALR